MTEYLKQNVVNPDGYIDIGDLVEDDVDFVEKYQGQPFTPITSVWEMRDAAPPDSTPVCENSTRTWPV